MPRYLYFVRNLATFVVVFLLLHKVVATAHEHFVLSQSLIMRNESQFQALDSSPNFIVLGDSHAAMAVDSRLLDNSFNWATFGEHYIQTYYKVSYLVEEKNWTEIVLILPLDPYSFSSGRTDQFFQHYYWKNYLNYGEIGYFKSDLSFMKYRFAGEFNYIAGIDEAINSWHLWRYPEQQRPLYNGFVAEHKNFATVPNQEQIGQTRAAYHLGEKEAVDADLKAYFVRLLQLAEKHDIQLVFVQYPLTSAYNNGVNQFIDQVQFKENITTIIVQETDRDLIILDYRDLFIAQEELFNDIDHLNAHGAAKLTEQLIIDLTEHNLISPP